MEIKLKEYGSTYNGKHNGWAYQLLDDNYEGIYLGVCCKDYLQDQIWSDLTQKTMTVYRQKSDYKGILDKQEVLKLCVYPYYFNNIYNPVVEDLEELGNNLQALLNEIEVLREFDISIVHIIDNKILIEFSRQWISKPWLLSLFTLLCRTGLWYNGNLEEYYTNLSKFQNPFFDNCDLYSINSRIKDFILILENKAILEQKDWGDLTTPDSVHGSGFFSTFLYAKDSFKILEDVTN